MTEQSPIGSLAFTAIGVFLLGDRVCWFAVPIGKAGPVRRGGVPLTSKLTVSGRFLARTYCSRKI